MPTPILATKLYIPRLRPNVVRRSRLLERLNEGLYRKLTLISAPAGFGKTTLVSQWLTGGPRPIAWLSLEDQENDPARFLRYLVAALQTIAASIGEGMLSALQSGDQRAAVPRLEHGERAQSENLWQTPGPTAHRSGRTGPRVGPVVAETFVCPHTWYFNLPVLPQQYPKHSFSISLFLP